MNNQFSELKKLIPLLEWFRDEIFSEACKRNKALEPGLLSRMETVTNHKKDINGTIDAINFWTKIK